MAGKRKDRPIVFIVTFFVLLAAIMLGGYMFKDYLEMQNDAKAAPCAGQPTLEALEKVISEHGDAIADIEKMGGSVTWGGVYVEIQTPGGKVEGTRCEGRGDVSIYYGTKAQRDRIKAYLGDSFFGIPYRMHNI